jgi:hypothetical protein
MSDDTSKKNDTEKKESSNNQQNNVIETKSCITCNKSFVRNYDISRYSIFFSISFFSIILSDQTMNTPVMSVLNINLVDCHHRMILVEALVSEMCFLFLTYSISLDYGGTKRR